MVTTPGLVYFLLDLEYKGIHFVKLSRCLSQSHFDKPLDL